MNSDEIGLGGSTSKRMKNLNAIVHNYHKASLPVHDLQLTSHISSLVRIAGAVTIHQLIAHESEHLYYGKMHAYSTSAASIDRNIFEASFSKVVFSDIIRIKSKLRSKTESILILINRLGDHRSPHIFPQAATININIIVGKTDAPQMFSGLAAA